MNTVIIKIESGVVAEIYSTAPLQAIIVDYDMIKGGETLERRMEKMVFSMTPEHYTKPEDIDAAVKSLVLECLRPADQRLPDHVSESVGVVA